MGGVGGGGVRGGGGRGLLGERGGSFKELEAFRCFEIKEAGVVVRELVKGNGFYFQNTGSQVIAFIASRLAKKNVLDCCAAPGTKSVTTALLNSQLDIYANDIHWGRARMIGEFVERLGLDRVRTVVSDIKTLPFKGNFDFIMVDAPCSSSGTLRKNPDLKLKVDGKRVARNAKEQYEIMQSLMAGCSTGGARILYSVCSFIKEETEDVMELSLAGSSGGKHIEIIDLTPVMEEYGFRYKKGKYGVYLLPSDELNNDLFYLALMKV